MSPGPAGSPCSHSKRAGHFFNSANAGVTLLGGRGASGGADYHAYGGHHMNLPGIELWGVKLEPADKWLEIQTTISTSTVKVTFKITPESMIKLHQAMEIQRQIQAEGDMK